jgi:hypothetical protein
MRLLNELVNLNNIDFSNFHNDLENGHVHENDAVKQFKRWLKDNERFASVDEVMASIVSGVGMNDVIQSAFAQARNLVNQLKQITRAGSAENLTQNMLNELKAEIQSIVEAIQEAFTGVSYQGVGNIFTYSLETPGDTSSPMVGALNTWKIRIGLSTMNSDIATLSATPPQLLNNTSEYAAVMSATTTDAIDALRAFEIFLDVSYLPDISNNEGVTVSFAMKLAEQKDKIVNQYKIALQELESRRCEARDRLNIQLANSMKAISYLNICISHNSGC